MSASATTSAYKDDGQNSGAKGRGWRSKAPTYEHDEHNVRRDANFHRFICEWTESHFFNGFIMVVILLNSFIMALETNEELIDKRKFFHVMDNFFLAVYNVEFIMKIYAEPKKYWQNAYNLFDFFVLFMSWMQILLTQIHKSGGKQLQTLRILRVLRTLRTLRTISFIKGLQVLVTALVASIRTVVINILLLLLVFMCLFAIMGYYFFGYKPDSDKEHWGSLSDAMLTLFTFVTVDGWTDLQQSLDEKGLVNSRYYTVLFIFLGHFIFTNVFIGVIIMNISEATLEAENELRKERETTIKAKKQYMRERHHREIQKLMEKQEKSDYRDFNEMLSDFQNSISHTSYLVSMDKSSDLRWMEIVANSLDHNADAYDRVQQLQYEIARTISDLMEEKLELKYGL